MGNAAVNICAQFVCECMFPFVWDVNPGLELLGHVITVLTDFSPRVGFYLPASLHTW